MSRADWGKKIKRDDPHAFEECENAPYIKAPKKTRVYLCKSKNGDEDFITEVRNYIKNNLDVEILEHDGGEYNPLLHKSCSVLIIVPPDRNKPYTFNYNVGRGQYDQIIDFRLSPSERNKDKLTLSVISSYEDEINVSDEIFRTTFIDEKIRNWKKDYSSVECGYTLNPIDNYFVPLESKNNMCETFHQKHLCGDTISSKKQRLHLALYRRL